MVLSFTNCTSASKSFCAASVDGYGARIKSKVSLTTLPSSLSCHVCWRRSRHGVSESPCVLLVIPPPEAWGTCPRQREDHGRGASGIIQKERFRRDAGLRPPTASLCGRAPLRLEEAE